MKVILNGARGKMGSAVWKMLEEGRRGMEIAAGIDPTADGTDPRILKNLSDYMHSLQFGKKIFSCITLVCHSIPEII